MSNPIQREQIILDSINEGVFTVDHEWRITSFNRAAETITGVPREQALGRICYDVFHSDICETACALRRTLSSGKPLENESANLVNSDGELVPVRISTAVLNDDNGHFVGGVETFQDLSRVERMKKELEERYTFEDIAGRSAAMRSLFGVLPPIAESDSTVLLAGESGTGKELFARAIHHLSKRADGPFVAVNCAALPDQLLESELFGYVAGAFTDARQDKKGRFTLADGGTLFLDEIGDISPAMQVRLLRVLQEHEFEPLGSTQTRHVNVRVIAATNQDLTALIEQGSFRSDLYYRIHVIQLDIPPLRQRREDIPLLATHLLGRIADRNEKNVPNISDTAMALLVSYDYPGNVRELENILEHAFVLGRGQTIQPHHLPQPLYDKETHHDSPLGEMSLEEMERLAIKDALHRTQGHRGRAAELLKINPSTLYRKIHNLQLTLPPGDGRRKSS
ncbi:sigma 54-interacting transcriptional regulator [bacterium]|nr:sigma 54-interacting transcriptional regulator [bacterium]